MGYHAAVTVDVIYPFNLEHAIGSLCAWGRSQCNRMSKWEFSLRCQGMYERHSIPGFWKPVTQFLTCHAHWA